MKAVVIGNANLDVICYPVDDVPRRDSISFTGSSVGPGGCGSNVALGLRALGVETALSACVGADSSSKLLMEAWRKAGIDLRWIRQAENSQTGVSVGLVDSQSQPRFIHFPGANASLTPADLDIEAYSSWGAKHLHVAGYFVLPGLSEPLFAAKLAQAHALGMEISLDVVFSPEMKQPSQLWPCLPHLDIFFCNEYESFLLTGDRDPSSAAASLRQKGAGAVIVKLGEQGCWLDSGEFCGIVPTEPVPMLDSSGAGDAFAAGFIAARSRGKSSREACLAANEAGKRMVGVLGAVAGWGYSS